MNGRHVIPQSNIGDKSKILLKCGQSWIPQKPSSITQSKYLKYFLKPSDTRTGLSTATSLQE